MSASVIRGTIVEGSGAALVARIKSLDDTYPTQAGISSISYTVIDQKSGSTITSGTLTITSVWFDTLQTPTFWDEDTTGYNFRWDSPKTNYPEGGRTYAVEVIFDFASGEDVAQSFEITTLPMAGS